MASPLELVLLAQIAALSTKAPPTGSLIMFGGAAAPTGWLKCDGSAVSRTTYSGLFAAIGVTYGSGDGSTTFNLPNLGAAFPYGNTPGSTGGAASHTHPLSSNGNAQISTVSGWQLGTVTPTSSWTPGNTYAAPTTGGTSASQTRGVALGGATDSASTLPPYVGVMFVIKT